MKPDANYWSKIIVVVTTPSGRGSFKNWISQEKTRSTSVEYIVPLLNRARLCCQCLLFFIVKGNLFEFKIIIYLTRNYLQKEDEKNIMLLNDNRMKVQKNQEVKRFILCIKHSVVLYRWYTSTDCSLLRKTRSYCKHTTRFTPYSDNHPCV